MMGVKMKYVVFTGHEGEQIIIFPKVIQHSVMADNVEKSSFGGMRPISGGFVVNGECVGRSESLNMDSRGDDDTMLIHNLLDIDSEFCSTEDLNINERYKLTPNKNKAKRDRKKRKK